MSNVLDKNLYVKRFNWEEAVSCMEEDGQRSFFNKLPAAIQLYLMSKAQKSICNGLDAGLCSDWEYVMRIAIEGSNLFGVLEGKSVKVADPMPNDSWKNCFRGIVLSVEDQFLNVSNEDGIVFNVDFSKVTFNEDDFPKPGDEGLCVPNSRRNKRFIVAIMSEYIRDAQAAETSEAVKWVEKGHWWDFTGNGILEIVESPDSDSALISMADKYQISEDILTTYELAPQNNQIVTVKTPNGIITAEDNRGGDYPGIHVKINEEAAATIEYDPSHGTILVSTYKQFMDAPNFYYKWSDGPRRMDVSDRKLVYLNPNIKDGSPGHVLPADIKEWYQTTVNSDKCPFTECLVILDGEYGILNSIELTHPGVTDIDNVKFFDVYYFGDVVSLVNDLSNIYPCKPVGYDIYISEGTGRMNRHQVFMFTPYKCNKDEYINRITTAARFLAEQLNKSKTISR